MHELIRIYFLSIWRNPSFEDIVGAKIFSFIVLSFYFAVSFLFGFFLDKILLVIAPDFYPIDTFCYYFLFLFVADIIIKFFVKSYRQPDILPYLTLPIPRKKIYSLLFIKELLSKWNFIWVVLLAPFFFKTVFLTNGLVSTLLLIFSVYFVCLTISFIIQFINILTAMKSFWHIFLPLLLALCFGYVAYNVASASQQIIDINLLFSQNTIEIFIGLVLLSAGLYVVFLKFYRHEVYLLLNGKEEFAITFNIRWINQFSINGEIIKLCLKEIVRSQLKRMIFYIVLVFIAGLYLFSDQGGSFLMRCFITLLPIILLGRVYGESTFNVESTFFDKLMVSPKRIPYLILRYKYIFCIIHAAFNTTVYVILFFNRIPLLFWISNFFFGCGILLFFAFQNVVYNNQRFDILDSLRIFSNFTFISIFLILFMIFSTGFVLVTIKGLTSETTAEWIMLITGNIGMVTSPFWLKNIYHRFLARKYQNMNGFRGN